VADIDDDQEGRPAFVGGQRAGVAFGLAAGAQQGVVETLAGGGERGSSWLRERSWPRL
jgi:hypothetical protein